MRHDGAARAHDPLIQPVPSMSETLRRCATCGHWATPSTTTCKNCGLLYEAKPLVGLDVVR